MRKELRKNASKSLFLYYYYGVQKHDGFVGSIKACSRSKTNVILMSLITFISMYVTVDDVNICDGLECLFVKYKSRASTAGELPD